MKALIDATWLMSAILAMVRIGGVLMFTPVLGFATLPVQIRLMLVLALSVAIFSSIPLLPNTTLTDLTMLSLAAIR